MPYFYIHPFKPQYFFPEKFDEHELFLSFYQPYTKVGGISWFMFRSSKFYRNLFRLNSIASYVPEVEINELLGQPDILVFNRGTIGPEQKISGLGRDKNGYFFFKYATTPLGIKNVKEEFSVLCQIQGKDIIARILDFKSSPKRVLLKTSILSGSRYDDTEFNDDILNTLIEIAQWPVTTSRNFQSSLKKSFAHGDFCPWNMMKEKNKILLFDWEMAANYPLGYDLFTFIFQTSFLLNSRKDVSKIFTENKAGIDRFFSQFGIGNWLDYLKAFTEIKISLEENKPGGFLQRKYKELLYFVAKA